MPTRTAVRDPFLAQQSDDDLVEQARRIGNDEGAYEELYRRHENAARNVARHILRSRQDADDVVNEAFAGVIGAITNGAGPRTNFRQYLMACVRNSCKSRRWSGGAISTDPSIMEQKGVCFEDPDRLSEQGLVASAFSSLSPDWQLTLWLTAVEERPTSEVAEQLGRRPAAVAALAHRAREAFAEAYLAQHQARTTSPACAKVTPKLAHYVRGNSGDVDTVLVERHLSNCVPCSCAVDELRDVNASLRTLTGPAPLLGAGMAVAGAGAAMLAGFVPAATAMGGWSLGAIGGATIAKAAVIGALLVPAAVMVAGDQSSSPTSRASAGAASVVTTAVRGASAGDTSAADTGELAEPVAAGAATAASVAYDPASGAPLGALGATPGAVPALSIDPAAAGHPLGELVPVTTIPGAPTVVTTLTAASVPPVTVQVPLPGGSGAAATVTVANTGVTVAATVAIIDGAAAIDLGAGLTGVNVGVDVTVPVVPIQVGAAVIPAGGVAAPAVSVGVNTPLVSVPLGASPGGATVLPPLALPSVSIAVGSVDLAPTVSSVLAPVLQVLLGNH